MTEVSTVELFDAIVADGYEQVLFGHDHEMGLRCIIAIHDTALGPSLGGVRMRPYASEAAALDDALRLARAMTYKFAAAGIDLGGGKSVIIGDPATDKTDALLRAYGRVVATLGGRYIPGIDVGTSQADLRTIGLEADSVSCTGADPSPFTALGVFATLRSCVRHVTGADELSGLRVAVQGVGHVGESLARYLAEAGADLVLADIDRTRAERLADELGGSVVDADAVVATACDVFAPCAVGGVINDETLPQLRCRIVAGGANNVLADPDHADALRKAGILYAPDYIANAGGVILLDVERAGRPGEDARNRCLQLGERMTEILRRADADDITPVAAADRLAEARLNQARARRAEAHRRAATRSETAADRVRRYYDLVDAGRLEEMYALFDDDIVYRRPGYEPLTGMAAFRAFYEGERVIRHGAHTLSSLVDRDGHVAVAGDFQGALHDGREVSVRFADFFTFSGERIIRRDTYFDAPAV